ncbi:MAG: hypothetical protein A4E49_01176 [Methanosaeta sp. PtaU1.Bin112]|nr:MAG: hypothetical protein A4E49_01176 [Methanosaeta sp. PtaU1.Bin112]
MKKFICNNCGALNVATEADLKSDGDWLKCTLPQGFEWILPAGKITPVIGEAIYISGLGEHLSREEYLNKHGIDPEIAYNLMRGNSGYRSASRNITESSAKKTAIGTKKKAQNWLDEDDWTS